jgi:hypothetical protein
LASCTFGASLAGTQVSVRIGARFRDFAGRPHERAD